MEKSKRVPTYIFIDEFENFSNLPGIELLFTESRKFNVKIIVGAHSLLLLPSRIQTVLLSNTSLKVATSAALGSYKAIASDMELSLDAFKSLRKYEFYMKKDDCKPQKFYSSKELIENSSYYFVLPNQRKYLEKEYLHNSGLYRIIHPQETSSPKTNQSLSLAKKPKFKL